MSDNTFNNKNFINPEEILGDPRNAFELLAQSAKAVAPFNVLGQPGFRKAMVIENAEPLTTLKARAMGVPAEGARISMFQYKVRLGGWSEHMLLPSPCTKDSNSKNSYMRHCHLTVIGAQDVEYGSTIMINEGDFVDVDMEKGTFQNDLQRARHGGMTARPQRRGIGMNCPGSRNKIAKNFANYKSIEKITENQQLFHKLLEQKFGGQLNITSYTRTPEEQAQAMMGLPLADLRTMYVGGSMQAAAAALVTSKTSKDPVLKDSEFNRAVNLIQGNVAQGRGSAHLTGRAIDVRTKDMSESEIDDLRYYARELGGLINLEPTKTGCWNSPGKADPSDYGNGNLERNVAANTGVCSNEHLHIEWPASWKPPKGTT